MTARLTVIACLAAAALTGCIDNDASVRLFGLCFPPTPTTAGCAYPATCDSLLLGDLTVDLGFTGGTFVLPVQVDNQRPSNAARDGGTETATAWIEEYKVTYATSNGAVADITFPAPARHPVEAAGSTVVVVPFVPAIRGGDMLALIPAGGVLDVSAELRARGHYGDETSFETGPFKITFTVTDGTYGGFACADPTQSFLGACPQEGQTAVYACQ
jgi:hypothetical protein